MKKRILSLFMMLCVSMNLVLVLPITSNASSDSDYVTVNLYTKKAIPMMGYSCIALGFDSTEVQIDSWDTYRKDFGVYTYGNEENYLHWALDTENTFIEANTLLMSVTFKVLGDNPEIYLDTSIGGSIVCDYTNNYNVIEDLHNYVELEVIQGFHRPIVYTIENDLNSILKEIKLCDTTIYGPPVTIPIIDYTFYPLKFDAKAVLNLAKFSKLITIDEEKKTVHVILGKKNTNGQASVIQTTDMCDSSWSKQYNEIKDLYKTMTGLNPSGSRNGVNNWNRFEKMKSELNHLKCDFIIDADMSVLGYLDFDYHTGKLKFSEGGIIETASLGMEFPSGKVLYVALGLKGSEQGTIKVTSSASGTLEPYMGINFGLTAIGKIGGNIGIAKIEGGIDATLNLLLQTINPNLKISMNGGLFVQGWAFNQQFLDQRWQYLDCELYPEFKNNTASLSTYSLTSNSADSTVDTINETAMDRNYLYDISLMSVTDENSIYTLNSVYPQNNAQLIRLSGDSMMLVWTGDDGTKSDINRSSLMYSIYQNGVWSEIKTINEDGTATGDFKVVTDESSVYIVYQKFNKILADDSELDDNLKEIDLYYTQYQDDSFTAPIRITDNNELCETIGDVDIIDNNLKVVWFENSENDILLSSGTNTIKEFIPDETIKNVSEFTASNEEYIGDICIGDDGIYYTAINSTNNTSVVYKYDTNATQILESDSLLSNLEYFDKTLYYIKNSNVYMYHDNIESAIGVEGINDFDFVTNGIDKAMLMSVFDGKASELYVSRFENDSWSQKDRFTDLNKYIKSYSPFMYSDGTINVAVSVADFDIENETVFGNTSLMVLNQCDYFDISTSYLYYEGEIAPNNEINLYFDATNVSSSELESINATLTDANGNTLEEHTLSCNIAPYAMEVLTIPYTLPDNITLSELNVEISTDKSEKDISNNTATVSYGYSNINVLPSNYAITSENTAEISTTIKNEGYSAADDVIITVYNGNKNDTILKEENIGTLNPGDSYTLNYTFPKELMVSSDNDIKNAIYVVATASSDESMYSDNEYKAVFDSAICTINKITTNDTGITVQFTKNYDKEALLIAASYKNDNSLCDVIHKPVNLTDTVDLTLDSSEAEYVSVYLWDTANKQDPLCNKLIKKLR